MELFYVIPLVLAILMVLYFLFQDIFPKKRVEHLPDRPARLPDLKHTVKASKATSPKAGTPASDDSPMVSNLAGVYDFSGTYNNGYNNSHGHDSGEGTKHGYGSGGYDSGSGGCGDSGGDSGGGDSGGGGGCD